MDRFDPSKFVPVIHSGSFRSRAMTISGSIKNLVLRKIRSQIFKNGVIIPEIIKQIRGA
jgi:hypothetical protein